MAKKKHPQRIFDQLKVAELRERIDSQTRAALQPETVAELREIIRDGDRLDPIIVYRDGRTYWTADGFHRLEACFAEGIYYIDAEVRIGNLRMARECGWRSNGSAKRTYEDRRRAVIQALEYPDLAELPSRQLAGIVRVNRKLIDRIKAELSGHNAQMRTVQVTRGGTTYPMTLPPAIAASPGLAQKVRDLPPEQRKKLIEYAETLTDEMTPAPTPIPVAIRQNRPKVVICTCGCGYRGVCPNGCDCTPKADEAVKIVRKALVSA
jgi:hypothetical protein